MNQIMTDLRPGNGDHVDGVLTRFFRSEMPHPWPECEASAQARHTPPAYAGRLPGRFLSVGRFALAASVVLFFLGYLTLAELFPRSAQGPPTEGSPPIAKTMKTPVK
jgi:hypothetical protein